MKAARYITNTIMLLVGLLTLGNAGMARAQGGADALAEADKGLLGVIPPTRPGEFESRPDADGNYVYEATSASPIVKGGKCEITEDKQVTGLMVVRSDSGHAGLLPDHSPNAGIYWTLGDIRPEKYWIGIVYQGGGGVGTYGPLSVYLNGRIVQMATQTDPVQVAPGKWFVEALAGAAEALQPGDEVSVTFRSGSPAVRLLLHAAAPAPAFETPWRMPYNFGGHQWNHYTALGVNAEGRFRLRGGAPAPNQQWSAIQQLAPSLASLRDESGKVHFSAWLANPLPVPVTVDYVCAVKTFYGDTVALDKERLTLAPHERIERTLAFDWQADEITHFADITLLGVDAPGIARSRRKGGLGWPPYETLVFFPDHRQLVPWPDPFNTRVIRRLTIDTPAGGARQTHGLDGGQWEMAYTTELEPPMPPPAELAFAAVNVPKGWGHPNLNTITPRPHGAYFKRSFSLAEKEAGRSYKLIVTYAYDEATAYVNGRKVGNVRGDNSPIVCDVTDAVKPGQNELVIVVRDLIAIMNPEYVTPGITVGNPDYLDAPGLHGKDGLGLGSVSIESAPLVSSEDVFVVTSVRKKDVSARITAANRGKEPVKVSIVAEILDDGEPVLELGGTNAVLDPHQPVEFTLEKPWANPTLWEPGQPHLYAMRVTIRDAAGAVLDVRRDRFGFRESWIDGPDIQFNGRAIKPVGYGPLHRFHPSGNFNFIRGGGRDWLDEVGILAYKGGISGVYNTSSQHNVENDTFWRTAERNTIGSVRLLQNSPHILAWDISNEWLCFLRYSVNDTMQGARRFKELSDVVRAYDPTRWTLGNGEGDFGGLLDNHSFHYMKPYHSGDGLGMRGHSEYLPDSAFWRELHRHLAPDEDIRYSPHYPIILRPDRKVVMDNEYLWKTGTLMPPGPSAVVGEDDVISPAMDSSSGPIGWMWKTYLDGHRDLGTSVVNHYSFHPGVLRGAHLPQAFIIPENQRHGYAGVRETRTFTLVNSLFRPCRLTLEWRLLNPRGRPVEKGRQSVQLSSGGIFRGEFAFTLPKVSRATPHTLRVTMEEDGAFICGEEWDIDVFPSAVAAVGELNRSVALFDPSGDTAARLAALGVEFAPLSELQAPASEPEAVLLVIGENALDPDSAGAAAGLVDFAERGGRILVLRQTLAPAGLPVATRLNPDIWSSQVFVRAGTHPVIEGLRSEDLHFWNPDRAVSTGGYTKPSRGNYVVLADSGDGQSGLEWVNLMEAYRGDGSYLLCQLPLVSRFDQEPMAREMLKRAIAYLGGDRAYKRPVQTLQVLAEKDGALVARLEGCNADYRLVAADEQPAERGIYLLDAAAARALAPERRAAYARALQQGATVTVVGATPEDAEWLTGLAGSPVSITAPSFRLWDGRGFRRGWSDATAGISHLDLYWKRYSGSERSAEQAEDPSNVIEPLQDFAAASPLARELVFPGALIELGVGDGTLLVDQRRWTTAHKDLTELASRNLSALLTGLEVNIAAYQPPKALPAKVDFRTIDLRPYANRALVDDVAEDGKGGWSDQGPAADLRTFPTGKQSFKGVPFDIGEAPNSCIVLASRARPGTDTMPRAVDVPVGFPAEGLYFMHASAYTGTGVQIANYRIHYADGSHADIPLIGGENLRDWAGPKALNNEKGTTTVVAWTGRNPVFPVIGVYRMLWVNDKPDVPIRSVEVSTPDMRGVLMFVGLTAAVKEGQFPVTAEDAARAAALLQEGRAAFARSELAAAREKIKAAIDLDPSRADAYLALVDVAERKGDDEWILEAYRTWIFSGPASPRPYNRIAETLEKRDDLQGALEQYRESLRVEWNQPPVIESVRRLEASL